MLLGIPFSNAVIFWMLDLHLRPVFNYILLPWCENSRRSLGRGCPVNIVGIRKKNMLGMCQNATI